MLITNIPMEIIDKDYYNNIFEAIVHDDVEMFITIIEKSGRNLYNYIRCILDDIIDYEAVNIVKYLIMNRNIETTYLKVRKYYPRKNSYLSRMYESDKFVSFLHKLIDSDIITEKCILYDTYLIFTINYESVIDNLIRNNESIDNIYSWIISYIWQCDRTRLYDMVKVCKKIYQKYEYILADYIMSENTIKFTLSNLCSIDLLLVFYGDFLTFDMIDLYEPNMDIGHISISTYYRILLNSTNYLSNIATKMFRESLFCDNTDSQLIDKILEITCYNNKYILILIKMCISINDDILLRKYMPLVDEYMEQKIAAHAVFFDSKILYEWYGRHIIIHNLEKFQKKIDHICDVSFESIKFSTMYDLINLDDLNIDWLVEMFIIYIDRKIIPCEKICAIIDYIMTHYKNPTDFINSIPNIQYNVV